MNSRRFQLYFSAPPRVAMEKKNVESKWIALAIAMVAQLGGIIWWASGLQSAVRHNDYKIQMMDTAVKHNSKFVLEWPAGAWLSGELPSDTRQDLKIASLEKQVDKIVSKIYNGK